ncbi:hypothetical protein J8273_6548 [Carpediemonas membranifera]|uniref:Centriolar satellite-associated tubulin polyglutamylase complex regulator 1 n=1 Tax=Carpediemonas membranifera TaxID=201153 RepID=A0A8J6B2V9_9EUKA|nr:hypothetical protein J8273_6548 [Carpediemonas membranifera]|eukprot:KAG9391769.1 hypothetical protein J8273_6548 [Carpediemonas membranifera]
MQNPSRQAKLEEERFKWSPKEYIDRFSLDVYVQDALNVIQNVPEGQAARELANYFASVMSGRNVLFREYDYSSRTTLNRWSLCVQLKKTTSVIDSALPEQDWHQWVRLLCPDFPPEMTARIFAISRLAGWVDGNKLATAHYVRLFELLFFYGAFLEGVQAKLDSAVPADRLVDTLIELAAMPSTTAPASQPIREAVGSCLNARPSRLPTADEFVLALAETSCLR